MEPYERLQAWRLRHGLALDVYRVTNAFPVSERYSLTSQARRAAFSAAVNIVEGSAKRGTREFRRYLDIAVASLAELGYVMRFARDLSILEIGEFEVLERKRRHASIVTWRLYRAMGSR